MATVYGNSTALTRGGLASLPADEPTNVRRAQQRESERVARVRLLVAITAPGYSDASSTSWYAIGRILGTGSFGEVRLAWHRLAGVAVAIKCYDKAKLSVGDSGSAVRRVQQEVRLMERLSHPGVVRMFEAIDSPKRVVIVMELADGGNLCEYVKMRGRLEEDEARLIFLQLILAVEYLHESGIVHRDLKLENILVCNNESGGSDVTVKIVDFGFSVFLRDPLKKLKIFCGTPSYMAPEIVQKREYVGRPVDAWSLGVLLFAIIAGHFPFVGKTYTELYARICTGAAAVSFPEHVSAEARDLIRRILHPDPARRMTLATARTHPWLAPAPRIVALPPSDHSVRISDEPSADLLEGVIDRLLAFGFRRARIIEAVLSRARNAIATTYYLTLARVGRAAGAVPKKRTTTAEATPLMRRPAAASSADMRARHSELARRPQRAAAVVSPSPWQRSTTTGTAPLLQWPPPVVMAVEAERARTANTPVLAAAQLQLGAHRTNVTATIKSAAAQRPHSAAANLLTSTTSGSRARGRPIPAVASAGHGTIAIPPPRVRSAVNSAVTAPLYNGTIPGLGAADVNRALHPTRFVQHQRPSTALPSVRNAGDSCITTTLHDALHVSDTLADLLHRSAMAIAVAAHRPQPIAERRASIETIDLPVPNAVRPPSACTTRLPIRRAFERPAALFTGLEWQADIGTKLPVHDSQNHRATTTAVRVVVPRLPLPVEVALEPLAQVVRLTAAVTTVAYNHQMRTIVDAAGDPNRVGEVCRPAQSMETGIVSTQRQLGVIIPAQQAVAAQALPKRAACGLLFSASPPLVVTPASCVAVLQRRPSTGASTRPCVVSHALPWRADARPMSSQSRTMLSRVATVVRRRRGSDTKTPFARDRQ